MTTPPALELQDLTVELAGPDVARPVLERVDLTIAAGEVVGLVGESGCGKSMTARAVLRTLPKRATASGTVRIGGEDVLTASGARLRELRARRVAMIYQDARAGINPLRRVGDFLTESLRLCLDVDRAAAHDRALELLDAVGLRGGEEGMRAYPHELSGGMLQRVMIAAALTGDPDLLLADEPTTALDVTIQAEIVGVLRGLQQSRQLAMLFITHDLELAASLCDRIYVMYAGRIVEERSARALVSAPRHPYTAALVASRPDIGEPSSGLSAVPGHPLTIAESLPGCPFAPRCTHRIAACETVRPELVRVDAEGLAACLRAEELGTAVGPPTVPPVLREAAARAEAAEPEAVLTVSELRKRYTSRDGSGEIQAVAGVSFELVAGGSLGIVGESGSGKSTMARLLMGLERPDAGTVELRGVEKLDGSLHARRERARTIQMVFQDPYLSLDPRISVAGSIDAVLRLHFPLSKQERAERVTQLLDRVGLGEREARAYPKDLSGGQRQRVAIARALAVEPSVLVLDEAVASLDLSIQAQILNVLAEIRDQTGISCVFISHDLAVVRHVTTETLVMHRGVVVEHGPTEAVLSAPQHPYTQLLLASVPSASWNPERISRMRRELAAAESR
jgi:peptide/nickel transport system ATP-binding protein